MVNSEVAVTVTVMAVARSTPGHASAMASPGLDDEDPRSDARFAMKLLAKSLTEDESMLTLMVTQSESDSRRVDGVDSDNRRPGGGVGGAGGEGGRGGGMVEGGGGL